VIVRWGIEALPGVLEELGVARPLLVASRRFAGVELPLDVPQRRRFDGVRPHADVEGVSGATSAAADADCLVAVGGGSAIDTAKAVSAVTGLPVVSIPTTYSGAEWTSGFGTRDSSTGEKRQGRGAHTVAIVYEPQLTLELPHRETCGTALNALAHCAEALYGRDRNEVTDEHALAGARLISSQLPDVVARSGDLEARTSLLEGAMHAGAAMAAGMCVGHAMAQALGGRFGLPHGAMNAVCLPGALRFNAEVAASAIERFGEAMGHGDPIARVEELAALGGFGRLRDVDVPEDELPAVATLAAARHGALANPRPAPAEAIEQILRELW
jgi:alcohol dehydrogenase class IV